jgi:hypothetical protein
MTEYLYQVATNGTCPPEKRRIVKETPKTYILDGVVSTRVLKRTMCSRFYRWFTQNSAAQTYYVTVEPKRH